MVNTSSQEIAKRRLKLRVAAKLMLYLGFASVVYVFFAALRSGDGEVRSVPGLRVEIGEMQIGEMRILSWGGRPVLVYRRSDAEVVSLRSSDERLLDPGSTDSEQPPFATNTLRSQNPDWFVSLALGTGQGCSVDWLPADQIAFQGKPWNGGFRDSCGQDRYDVAGRVYKSQYARRNLIVPQYSIDGDTLILGR